MSTFDCTDWSRDELTTALSNTWDRMVVGWGREAELELEIDRLVTHQLDDARTIFEGDPSVALGQAHDVISGLAHQLQQLVDTVESYEQVAVYAEDVLGVNILQLQDEARAYHLSIEDLDSQMVWSSDAGWLVDVDEDELSYAPPF